MFEMLAARHRTACCIGVIAAATIATLALLGGDGVHAHSGKHFAAGQPGDPKKPSRTITVVAREDGKRMLFEPERVEVRQGEQIRFVIWNEGTWDHEFLLDSFDGNAKHKAVMQKHPEMEHDDPNGKTIGVSEKAEVLWRFTKVGTFEYACLLPGHYEAGMKGVVVVAPRKSRRGK
jgi:uncharacterized cupredoxin-like copper-binding protein